MEKYNKVFTIMREEPNQMGVIIYSIPEFDIEFIGIHLILITNLKIV